ncbi:MAG: hypothetical protein ACU837_08170 [Gammaproteobacteria bacterium]
MRLLKEYLLLCWFKNNPIDIQPSRSFIWKNLLFYVVVGIIVEANISDPVEATIEIFVETVITVILIAILLLFTKKLHLFKQLLTSLIVCENFILVLGIITEILDVAAQQTEYEDYPMYLGGALVVWFIAIASYIMRQVFSFNTMRSVSLAIFYFVFTFAGTFVFLEVL